MRRREFLGCAAGAGLSGSATADPPTAGIPHALADLDRVVQSLLTSKRLGQPVFVRLTWHGASKPVEQLALLTALTSRWLGQTLVRLHAVGEEAGPLSLTLLFAAGASAMVSVIGGEPAGPLDLMLLGSQGAVYHEATETFTSEKDTPDPKLVKSIRRALTKGSPIDVEAP